MRTYSGYLTGRNICALKSIFGEDKKLVIFINYFSEVGKVLALMPATFNPMYEL